MASSPQPAAGSPGEPRLSVALVAEAFEAVRAQVERRVLGQRATVDLLLTALFAEGHAVLVGVPGLAKTLLVSSVAEATQLEFSRIQFTPDLMPSDVTGSEILEEDAASGRRGFRFVAGPIFANLLLADEINRTPPKTQSALLQAMQERKVSIGGRTHPLPEPFAVLATQNPIEQEGTYPLPEAQLDRFMFEIEVGYPAEADERRIVAQASAELAEIEPVLSPAALIGHQRAVRNVPVPESVVGTIVGLIRATRPGESACPPSIRELIRWGAGPRAGQLLLRAAQAHAAALGQPAVTVEHVRAVASPVLRHRIVPSYQAEARGLGPADLVGELLGRARP